MSKKVLIVLVVLVAVLGFFLKDKILSKATPSKQNFITQQNESPKIVSTKPDPLDHSVIGARDNIEITFNRSLENVGEFKIRIEPKIEYKVELSSDRKTAKIIFAKPLELDSTYTLFIGTDTKFDGVGAWGEEKIFHFRTIKYRGV